MEEQMRVSNSSVWGSSQHPSNKCRESKEPMRRNIAGRLVAVTATGPIYRGKADLVVVPVSVGLAFTQELAARAINPEARVVSSLANRVSGDTAMSVWADICGMSSAALIGASPRARLIFLNQVLAYVRRQGNVNGIEPILGAAVNSAWPWINPTTLARILSVTSKYLSRSEFSGTTAIPVLDPNTRTFVLFAPGALAKIDPNEWLNSIVPSGGGFGTPGLGSGGGFDPNGPGGLLGPGMPGHHGLDLSGLQGPDGQRPRGGNSGGFDPNGPGGLLGPGMPGHRGLDLGNLGGNGGPYGFGSGLGWSGAATPNDEKKTSGSQRATDGRVIAAFGAAAAVAGLIATGAGNPFGLIAVAVGGFAIGYGVGMIQGGEAAEREADLAKPGPAEPTPAKPSTEEKPKPTEPTPAEPSTEEKPKPTDTTPAKPNPEKPKHSDLYPDPDGGGGGGNPTQLPDFDGSGGGNPTTLWDEDGDGGSPTTLWDENGGGGNPTTKAEFVTTTVLTGRGLLAGVVQVGPATFAF